jgi:hypothetical protein
MLSNKTFNDNDRYDFFTVKEWDAVTFKYPVIIMIKGCLEMVSIDLSNMKIYYFKLEAPFCIFTQRTCKEAEKAEITGLMDKGDCYQYMGFTIENEVTFQCQFFTYDR